MSVVRLGSLDDMIRKLSNSRADNDHLIENFETINRPGCLQMVKFHVSGQSIGHKSSSTCPHPLVFMCMRDG